MLRVRADDSGHFRWHQHQPPGPLQVVKAPGNLVISAYVTCPDITLTVTPDLKLPGSGKLLWVDLGCGKQRLGGSALAHAYSQVRLMHSDIAQDFQHPQHWDP